ncbi:CD99 antigen-like protein 2 [Acomys russatus]|uniref:CD99 antigen-like protein 2 n=1 Tax=Acomys russatus TaxID=60746 RepID=UPI0021E2D561|nr:CD99 antigen-like protein 2 [Acomys russatus]
MDWHCAATLSSGAFFVLRAVSRMQLRPSPRNSSILAISPGLRQWAQQSRPSSVGFKRLRSYIVEEMDTEIVLNQGSKFLPQCATQFVLEAAVASAGDLVRNAVAHAPLSQILCFIYCNNQVPGEFTGDSQDFNLEDALKETSSVKQRRDHFTTTTTRRPVTTRPPSNPMEPDELSLYDALDDQNDLDGNKKPNAGDGGGFSNKDLEDILGGGGYKPDKNKGGGSGGYGSNDDPGSGISTETGTIAGVASALAMALIGAVSSYISYQQKKFCFSIQQGLNADYVKGENLEAVVCEEPQVTYSRQDAQSAEPSAPEPPRI